MLVFMYVCFVCVCVCVCVRVYVIVYVCIMYVCMYNYCVFMFFLSCTINFFANNVTRLLLNWTELPTLKSELCYPKFGYMYMAYHVPVNQSKTPTVNQSMNQSIN